MPGMDAAGFKALKKACGKGKELGGKTMGIIGCGRIGQALASLALGSGMRVLPHRRTPGTIEVPVHIHGMDPIMVSLDVVPDGPPCWPKATSSPSTCLSRPATRPFLAQRKWPK